MLLLQCLGAAAAGAAVFGAAFRKPLWIISVGYGTAMTLQSCLTALKRPVDAFGKAHVAMVALYGVRMVTFLLWRDRLTSFQPLKEKHEAHANKISAGKRAFMWGGCALLYWAMFLPAFYSSKRGPKAAPTSPLGLLSSAALVLAGASLAWEAAADVAQQLYYERGGKSPCRAGPWRISSQANYQGEMGFWVFGYLAGLRSYPSPLDALYASIGTAGIVWILTHESQRRTARRTEATDAKAGRTD